jgi:hypothetical protein
MADKHVRTLVGQKRSAMRAESGVGPAQSHLQALQLCQALLQSGRARDLAVAQVAARAARRVRRLPRVRGRGLELVGCTLGGAAQLRTLLFDVLHATRRVLHGCLRVKRV